MGVCFQRPSDKITCNKIKSNILTNCNQTDQKLKNKKSFDNYLGDSKNESSNERFTDFPEWEGDRYKGFGIKRMKGYKCTLNIDHLNALREEFWTSKLILSNIWKTIRQACIYDHIKCEEYLLKHHIVPLDNCVNALQDDNQNIYLIPNFCINDPFFEKELLPVPPEDNKQQAKSVNIKMYNLYKNETQLLQVPSTITGAELKRLYIEKNNINIETNKVKLIFAGAFIEDNQLLCQHQVKNDFIIQVVITPIE